MLGAETAKYFRKTSGTVTMVTAASITMLLIKKFFKT